MCVCVCVKLILLICFSLIHVCNNTLFFKVLERNREIDSPRIWNCDESGFPTDPSKGCVIAKKVSENKTLQIFYFFSITRQILQINASICKKVISH